MTDKDIIIFFAVVQTSAVLGSFLFGILTDAIGPKKTILIFLGGFVKDSKINGTNKMI